MNIPYAALFLAAAALQPATPALPDAPLSLWQFPIMPEQHGLWIGPIHACRDTVTSAVRTTDRAGEAVVEIHFRADVQPRLEQETMRLLERQMPIRLNGRPVAAPFVEGRIQSAMTIHVEDERLLKKMAAAALREC